MQFHSYAQVLDIDNDLMLVYLCQETAQFFNEKTDIEIAEKDIFNAMLAQKNPSNVYDLANYENLSGIKV